MTTFSLTGEGGCAQRQEGEDAGTLGPQGGDLQVSQSDPAFTAPQAFSLLTH